jgi:DNA replication protein DnaC
MTDPSIGEQIRVRCVQLQLPTIAVQAEPCFQAAGYGEALPTLLEVLDRESDDRHQRRVERLRRAAKLPPGKTPASFDPLRLPPKLRQQLVDLARGEFVEHATNVLAFGLPGTGKSHAMAALGHALVLAGRSVLFVPAYQLVQDLLAAKRDLTLPRALRRLDAFEVVILDDLGYVQQDGAEADVLFTLMDERRSLVITSNLVFSQWDQIFRHPMATAAAIDRIVHHSVILEFDVPSYRTDEAKKRQASPPKDGGAKTQRKK